MVSKQFSPKTIFAGGSGAADWLASVAEKSPVGIFLIQNKIFRWVNRRFQENTGYRSDELIGKPSLSLVYPDDRALVESGVRAMLRGEPVAPYEYRLVAKDGHLTWNVGTVTPFEYCGGRATLGIQMDISRQKQAEEALRQSEDRSRIIIDSIADAYYEVDLAGNLLIFNEPYLKLFGYGAGEMQGMNYQSYVDKKNAAIAFRAFNAVFKTGRPIDRMEWEIINKSGETRHVELSVSRIEDGRGKPAGFRGIISDITARHKAEEAIRRQAFHDPLTGLANRILFSDRLLMAVKRAARAGQKVAVMILDLDHFKEVNDRWGHAAGDALLNQVGHRLLSLVRDSDTVGRHGGDEFAVIISPIHDCDDAKQLAGKIIEALRRPFLLENREAQVTASLGVSLFPDHGDHFEELLRKADAAMYKAKGQGRNRYAFYEASANQRQAKGIKKETVRRVSDVAARNGKAKRSS